MADKKKRISVNPLAEGILRPALRLFFRLKFNIQPNIPKEVHDLKPPFLVLANHQGFWDPFMAGVYLKPPTYYITSDAVFRSRLFSFLLKFLGAIPKTKAQSDLDALKNIFSIKDQGKNIGIFPEGQRTWNGTTLPLIKSTSKLIRMLKIPVVTVVFKGGFLSHPRWGTSIRKGRLVMDYRLLFSGEELGAMKVSDLHRELSSALYHDEVEYQRNHRIEYGTGHLAENIEQALFVCPSCGSFEGFNSAGDGFSCKNCGKAWVIDKYQMISAVEGDSCFDNILDWDHWQMDRLRSRIDERVKTGAVLLEDENVVFHTGFRSRVPRLLSKGAIRLTPESLILLNTAGEEIKVLSTRALSGINVQNKEILDLYFENVLYTVRDPKNHFCSYKWWRAVDYLQREKLGLNIPD